MGGYGCVASATIFLSSSDAVEVVVGRGGSINSGVTCFPDGGVGGLRDSTYSGGGGGGSSRLSVNGQLRLISGGGGGGGGSGHGSQGNFNGGSCMGNIRRRWEDTPRGRVPRSWSHCFRCRGLQLQRQKSMHNVQWLRVSRWFLPSVAC